MIATVQERAQRRRAYLDGRWSHRPTAAEAAHVLACVEGHPRVEPQHLAAFERWAAGGTLAEVGREAGRSSTTVGYWLARVWIAYADTHEAWEGSAVPLSVVSSLMRAGTAHVRRLRWRALNARQRAPGREWWEQ